jgi:hypothetical protein
VLGYRDEVHNFEVFNDHTLTLMLSVSLSILREMSELTTAPVVIIFPRNLISSYPLCLLVLLRGRRRKMAQEGIVRNTVIQYPIHVYL